MVPVNYFNLFGYISGGLSILMLFVFYGTRLRYSRLWTIVVTPLASIIGSGFLVVAPLLYQNFGRYHSYAIVLINLFALGIGWILRTNIHHFEPLLENGNGHTQLLLRIESGARILLGVSYIISVGFYLSLLSSFALNIFEIESYLGVRLLTTAILIFIGLFGFLRGLHGLEKLEKISVNIKLSVIAGLVLALILSAGYFKVNGTVRPELAIPSLSFQSLQILGGMLLIVQGFETTRYLGKDYTAKERARGLLIAQLIAALIYIVFVPLAAPLAVDLTQASNETAIISIVGRAGFGLATSLSLAAIFSQFGAAVADTVGSGGILEEETRGRVRRRVGYLLVTILAAITIWTGNIFSVLSLASRAFALYYAFQAVMASILSYDHPEIPYRRVRLILFPVLAVILVLIAIFAIPAH
ncbi:MAG: hypothetical protein E4G99_05120 [Anaerolineales bacterium]|nr:MAG: hypothetical protein E4G99_05120 [Anaerolineales bacterium]